MLIEQLLEHRAGGGRVEEDWDGQKEEIQPLWRHQSGELGRGDSLDFPPKLQTSISNWLWDIFPLVACWPLKLSTSKPHCSSCFSVLVLPWTS